MKRRSRLDAIDWDRLVQDDSLGELSREDEAANAARAENPARWDATAEEYRRVDRLVREHYEEAPQLPKRSPLQGALEDIRKKEHVRSAVRKVYDERLVALGFQNAVARAAQSLTRGALGVSYTLRGLGRILGTFNTTVNIVVFDRMGEISKSLGAGQQVVDITPKSPEEEPA